MGKQSVCSISNCGNKQYARGWCENHYGRWRRHGDPQAGRVSPGIPLQWLNEHCNYEGDECLIWPFADDGKGYGVISIDGNQEYAHRFLCSLTNGAAPSNLHEVAHSCGRGHLGCVNPKHLRWATRSQNHADKLIHGTHHRGERCPTAKITEENALEIFALKGKVLQRQIAERFGITLGHVSEIHRSKRWAWLTDERNRLGSEDKPKDEFFDE